MKSAPTEFDKKLGISLRRLRWAKGVSQSELAAAMEISFQQLQKYEKGTNRVTAARLALAARYLGVSLSVIFDEPIISRPKLSKEAMALAGKFDSLSVSTRRAIIAIAKIDDR